MIPLPSNLCLNVMKKLNHESLHHVIDYLSKDNGLQSNSWITTAPSAQSISLIPICKAMLSELLNSGNITDLKVPSFNLIIREVAGNVEISSDNGLDKIIFENISREDLQKLLIHKLIIKGEGGLSSDTINLALKQLILKWEDESDGLIHHTQFFYELMNFILLETEGIVGEEIKFNAIKFILKNKEYHSPELIHLASEQAIRLNKYCNRRPLDEAARIIIEARTEKYDDVCLVGASIYIISHANIFFPNTFARAVKHLLNNKDDYPKGFLKTAAGVFIKENLSFFTEPLTNQSRFVQFYSIHHSMMSALENYSNALNAILSSDGRTILAAIKDPNSGEVISQEMTILDLWQVGHFEEALKSEVTCLFLLRNVKHDVFELWNCRKRNV